MASITKHGDGWRAFVYKKGKRATKTCKTKAEAKAWALKIEHKMEHGAYIQDSKNTFEGAINRYLELVSPQKASYKMEKQRLLFFKKHFPIIARKNIIDVTSSDIAEWRDDRLKTVSQGTVNREANILRNIFTFAKKEWGWISSSPFESVKMPKEPAPRTRRIRPQEVKAICRELGYITGEIETKSQETALAFLISLRTAMRSGEILSLNKSRINLKDRVLTVPHKTQYITRAERQIPITRQAARLIDYLVKRDEYFTVTSSVRDALFRKAVQSLGIEDLHFHDARAEALTRLSRRVDVMTLAKISGHRDISILQNTYYRETAADIAKRL